MAVVGGIFLLLMYFSAEIRLRKRFERHPSSWSELAKEIVRKHPDPRTRSLRFALVVSFSFTFWERALWTVMGQPLWIVLMLVGSALFVWLLFRRIKALQGATQFVGISPWQWTGLLGAWVLVMQPWLSGPLCLCWLLILSERARRRPVSY